MNPGKSPLHVVLDALDERSLQYRRIGDQADAQCPAHHDNNPSLSIRYDRAGGKVLLNCHTGCAADTVLHELGLTWADLFDPKNDQSTDRARRPEIVATYDYTDEHGEVLFQKLRYFPKTFKVRRPDGRGGWTWSIGDAPRVLYRLPEIRAAITSGRSVVLVEGEKDADRITEQIGMAATCNYEGAAKDGHRPKWRPEYTEQLRGANVLIVADNDEAGYAHAFAACRALTGVARSVRVFRAAVDWPKADITDHLDTGHGLEHLVPVVPSTEPQRPAPTDDDVPAESEPDPGNGPGDQPGVRTVRLRSAATFKPKRARWLWDQRMPQGELTLLGGREGIGKSAVTYTLVADITRGRMRGESHGRPRNVAIAATEDSVEHTIVPRLMAAGADLERVFFVEVTAADGYESVLTLPRDLDDCERLLVEHDMALLVLDPLVSRIDGKLDTHKDSEVRQGLEPLVRMGQRSGTSILGLIHVNKASSNDPLNSIMGSRAFAAVARAVLFAMSDPDDRKTTLLGLPKSNLGPTDVPTLTFTLGQAEVAVDDDGTPITAVQVLWGPDRDESVRDVMEIASTPREVRTATDEAADWLEDHLMSVGGSDRSATVKQKAYSAGHSESAVQRGRAKLRLLVRNEGMPRTTWWSLPD